jgi:hypothetical protein
MPKAGKSIAFYFFVQIFIASRINKEYAVKRVIPEAY